MKNLSKNEVMVIVTSLCHHLEATAMKDKEMNDREKRGYTRALKSVIDNMRRLMNYETRG